LRFVVDPPLIAAIEGGPRLVVDVLIHLLSSAGVEVIDIEDAADASAVTVLVASEADDWDDAHAQHTPVVLVTRDPCNEDVVVSAVLRGADAVVHADAHPSELIEAIRVVRAGGTHLDPLHARALADSAREQSVKRAAEVRLTPRETDILESIERGESVKQTARALGISVKTVENTQSRLFRKLGARNRAQAVKRLHLLGLFADRGDATPLL
jgi:DNA-binding NarL/FixJ family response regulator